MFRFLQKAFLSLALGAAVGFLGAKPMTSAAGYPTQMRFNDESPSPQMVTCGTILFFLTIAVIGPVQRGVGGLIAALNRSKTKPAPPIAMAMIVCGTLCSLGSLLLAWTARSPGLEMLDALKRSAQNGMNINFNLPAESFQGGSVGPMVMTALVFTLGASLIGVGIWASLDASPSSLPTANGPLVKEPIPADSLT